MVQGWVTEMEEVEDMRLGNIGRLLLHLQTGKDRLGALGSDRGNKLHHEGLQIWSNLNQAFALERSNR